MFGCGEEASWSLVELREASFGLEIVGFPRHQERFAGSWNFLFFSGEKAISIVIVTIDKVSLGKEFKVSRDEYINLKFTKHLHTSLGRIREDI
jgi:hypothetical protein